MVTDGPMPLKERRRIAHEGMVQAILEISRQLMRERGAGALNLTEVARRLGIKPPSLYEYFPSKMAIYEALYVMAYREFEARLQLRLQAARTVWDVVRVAMEAQVGFAQESPELFQIGFQKAVACFEPSESSKTTSQRIIESLRQGLRRYLESAEIQLGTTSDQVLDLLMAVGLGLAALHMANEPHLPAGQGRFGRLIPLISEVFREAWSVDSAQRPPQNSWGISV